MSAGAGGSPPIRQHAYTNRGPYSVCRKEWCKSMFMFRRKSSGNKFTFISIIIIIVAFYVLKSTMPQKETEYPDIIRYNEIRYEYSETLKSSPFLYVRKNPVCEEGYIVLARRGRSIEEEAYIYEGRMKYRRYTAMKGQ